MSEVSMPQALNDELWPQMKVTERAHRPYPNPYHQSREAEHPKKFFEKLGKRRKRTGADLGEAPIAPPQNSDSRLMRDAYFS